MSDSLSKSNNNSITNKISSIFSAIRKDPYSAFQIKFKDRQTAANILSATLQDRLGKDLNQKEDFIILGIPRGGVVVAGAVAIKLKIQNFDIVVPRKLTDIDNKEQAIGAIIDDETVYLDEQQISDLQIDSDYINQEIETQMKEIKRRKSLYRISDHYEKSLIDNKIVILIDDGAASGATLIAASRWIRKTFDIKQLIIAVPVIPKENIDKLKKECDEIVAVSTPTKYFHFVGQYYKTFSPIPDEEVIRIMKTMTPSTG